MKVFKYFIVITILFFSNINAQISFDAAKIKENVQKIYPMDGSHILEAKNAEVYEYFRNNPEALTQQKLNKTQSWGFTVGTAKNFYAYDFTASSRYSTAFTCRAIGNNCYIFVEDSLWGTRVNQAGVDSVLNAFDVSTPANPSLGIYGMDVNAFGNPLDVDNDPRIVILILNIRDGFSGSGGYVAGYFDSYNEITSLQYPQSNKGEFYYLDANPLNLTTENGIETGMSTAAHEFQHMINFNYHTSTSQLTFINESCSMLAELYCGYPSYNQSLYGNETNYYLLGWRTNDNTLVLNDYSRAQRFSLYLWDQFGLDIFKYIVQSSSYNGIPLYNYALQQIGQSLTFNDVFINWLIANSLDDTTNNRSYGYDYPDLYKAKATTYYNPNASGSNTLDNLGADYITFSSGSDLNITFTSASSSIIVKAIKIGSGTHQVVDVPLNSVFNVSDFGSTYSTVTFVVINTNQTTDQSYSFTSTGTVLTTSQELKWDTTEPTGYLPLPAGDSVCVVFDAYPGATIDSVKVGLRQAGSIEGGVWRFNSNIHPLGEKLTSSFIATITTTPSYPYPDPWPNWSTVDLHSYNISADQSFVVAFGISASSPGVMITEYPGTNYYHSLSYSTENNQWLYWTSTDNTTYIYLIRAYVSLVTSVGTKEVIELTPADFKLSQNYPNPFNPSTSID